MSQKAHLYGGPLDGLDVTIPPTTSGWADQETGSIYTYSPTASVTLGKITFLHSSIEHDALDPSLRQQTTDNDSDT